MTETEASPRGREATSRARPTDELGLLLERLLRAGTPLDVAADAAGVDLRTLDAWLLKGASAPHGRYRDLYARVVRARAEGEARQVAIIAQAATTNWQAAAWLLERGYPERWARLSQRERASSPPEAKIPTSGDPFAEVDELARRRRDG